MVSSARGIFLLWLLAACWLRPADALAQQDIRRCTTGRGNTIYTDRRCDEVGASERLPRGDAAPPTRGGGLAPRAGCARNLRDLVYEITSAIDNHDVNRLGAVYHWVGMDAESGYRILERLQTIVDRPLVDIAALGPAAPAFETAPVDDSTGLAAQSEASASPPDADPTATSGANTDTEPRDAEEAAPQAAPAPPRRRLPTGLRLEQTLRNSTTPSRTVFGLRRHLDCWWIAF